MAREELEGRRKVKKLQRKMGPEFFTREGEMRRMISRMKGARMPKGRGRGWFKESARHSLAARGIKVGRNGAFSGRPVARAKFILEAVRKQYASEISQIIDQLRATEALSTQDQRVLDELEWVLVQLHDDPERLLREKWGV